MFSPQIMDVCGDKNATYDLITTEHIHKTSHYTLYIHMIMSIKNKI